MNEPLRLLTIASRPSDYGEMSELACALAARGHLVSLLYFYSRDDASSAGIIEQLASLGVKGVHGAAVEVSNVPEEMPLDVAAAGNGITRDNESPVADSARSIAGWLRRHRLGFYPKGTVFGRMYYSFAHFVDAITDRERVRETFGLLTKLWPRLRELPLGLRAQAIRPLHRAAGMLRYYRRIESFMLRTIARRQLDAILIPEDIVGAVWPVAVAAGHASGIPVLVVPYTIANREEAVQSLKGADAFQSQANRVAAALYPHWRYRHGGVDIVRLPSDHIFAHEIMGLTPPDPWMMNSGFADAILVDSQASHDYFEAAGIPAAQMRTVGSVSQDRMYQLRQQRDQHLGRLRRELGLSGDKPLLLISGCPNQLTAPVPYCEFGRIEDVASFVGESLAPLSDHYHLVVRPHPNFLEFGAMLEPFKITTTTAPTASLVPLADVFVAFASATIRWSIACGVPAVNYDVFHYGYADFAAANGVRTVDGAAEFRALVRSLTPGSATLAEMAGAARADSTRWSVMDGHGIERIEAAIKAARQTRADRSKEQTLNA